MPRMGRDTFVRIRFTGGDGSFILAPVLTTTQRDALTAAEGYIIFNSTTDQLEEYDGATWQAVGQVILDTHTADLDAHFGGFMLYPKVEKYLQGMPGVTATSFQVATAYLHSNLVYVARAITIDRIAIEITTQASAGGECRLGIYNTTSETDLSPGALRTDYGTLVTDAGTGIKAITISPAASLPKGWYWFAITHNDVTTVVTCRCASAVWSPLSYRDASFNPVTVGGNCYGTHAYAALPNPFPAVTYYSSRANLVLPRVASLA